MARLEDRVVRVMSAKYAQRRTGRDIASELGEFEADVLKALASVKVRGLVIVDCGEWILTSAGNARRNELVTPAKVAPDRQLWRSRLTPRQAEVVELLAQGLHDPEIAERLGVCHSTVKHHLSEARLAIPSPTGTLTRVQLARWWWENVELPTLLSANE